MKNLKLMLAALALCFAAANVQAQKHHKMTEAQKQEMAEQREKNLEKLQLSPEQQASFKAINKKYGAEMKALRQTEADRKDKMAKGKDLRARKNEEMKALLSEKQYQAYLDMQQERKQKMMERRGK